MEKLKFIHDIVIHWIDKTDSKANVILGIKLFVLGYLLTLLKNFEFGCNWISVLLVLYGIFSFISFFFIVKVFYPQLSTNEPHSSIYFKHIADKYRNNKEQGLSDLKKLSDKGFVEDLSNQIISLAIVAREKYSLVQKGMAFMVVEIILLVWLNLLLSS